MAVTDIEAILDRHGRKAHRLVQILRDPVRLTFNIGYDIWPAWSADGKTLEHTGTIRPDEPAPYDGSVQKYQDEYGRTIVDTYESGALVQREGGTDRVLDYLSGSGTDTLSFSYTVQAGDASAGAPCDAAVTPFRD